MINNKHIKQAIICALVCVYSFALLKPVMPVVNDVVAHTFFKMQHMATVHYENGKHHLHVELLSGLDEQEKEPARNIPSSIYETLSNHICTQEEEIEVYLFLRKTIIPHTAQHSFNVFIKDPTPPPKA